MKALIYFIIGLLMCVSARAQVQPFPNPGDWFVPVARDDTTFYNTLLYNAQGEWPVSVVNLEIIHPTPFLVEPRVQGVLKTYLEVTCSGTTNGPDGTPYLRYRYTFPIPANLYAGGYTFLVFKRCAGSTGAYTPVSRTDYGVGFFQPYTPGADGNRLAVFPRNPRAGEPFVVAILNAEFEEISQFSMAGNHIRFYLQGSFENGFLPNAERPIRRTITLPAGNYVLNQTDRFIDDLDILSLPFQVSGGVVARPLPASNISSQLFLGLLLVVAGILSLRRMRVG
jgi:hypothetical protein